MYNSDNTIFIQKYGQGWPKPDETVPELKNMTVAEYFGKEIIIPMAEDIWAKNPNLNEKYMEKLMQLKGKMLQKQKF